MYRVLLSSILALFLTGCSMGGQSLTAGYAESSIDASEITTRSNRSRAARVESAEAATERSADKSATAGNKRVAMLNDRAPAGSFETAPRGALADRDYSQTRPDPERALQLVNAYRKSKGLRPLTINAELTLAARNHARDLARWDRISHYGSDGSNPWDRVKRTGYNARLAAENVGTGQASVDEVFKGWQASPGHNKNLLLPDATHMGLALVHDPKTEFKTFWALVLGAPL